jgi:uncharacterized protein (DUF58 family)
VRAALAGLTTRGRSFLAAGVALTVCALLLGERDLMRVGIFLLALPVIAVIVVSRTRYRLACSRVVDPERVPSGRSARVVLRLENLSRLPTGVLLVEDGLPYVLGGRPRFVLDRVESRGVREVTYTVQSDLRGRYQIGPLAVRLTDPFGFVELTRRFRNIDHLVVTPVVTLLPALRIGGERTGGGDSQARAIAIAGEDDVATREYRQGDELRRVHWRSTAHAGELMVRREEQPWQSHATLFLDTRDHAHQGDGPGSSFEWAVAAAASIGVHLVRQHYALRYLTDAGDELRGVGGVTDVGGGPFEGQLLDALATVRTSRTTHLETSVAALRHGGDSVVVAILGSLSPEDGELLTRLRTGSRPGIAVLIDASSWAGLSPRDRALADQKFADSRHQLIRTGWRILAMDHRTPIESIWPLAAGDPGTAVARLEAVED